MNDNDQLDWNSCLIFQPDVPKLETLASSRFALSFWRNEIINDSLEGTPTQSTRNQKVEKFCAENLSSIPPRILDLISNSIQLIGHELWTWLYNNEDRVNRREFMKKRDTWAKYFDDLVWNVSYSIDCPKTCVNLLRSNRVSDEEKFTLACSYCLQEHIEGLWERVRNVVDYKEIPCGPPDSWLLSYWIDRMRDQEFSQRISKNYFDENDLVWMENEPLNRFATEYFWPYLSFECQTEYVLLVIRNRNPILKYLLPKLNDFQLQTVVAKEGYNILQCFIEFEKCRHLAIPFWNHFKNMFQEYHFLNLVGWMLRCEVGESNGHVLCEHEVSLCKQIWNSAPDRLKKFVFRQLGISYLAYNMRILGTHIRPNCSVSVLKMVLSEASSEQRSSLWRQYWLKFSERTRYSDMNELLELCLEDVDRRNEFKREFATSLREIRTYCFSLLDNMELDRLDEFLRGFSIDHDAKMALKQRLVSLYFFDPFFKYNNLFFQRVNELLVFLDETFPDLQTSEEFKRKFQDSCYYCLSSGSFPKFDASHWQDLMMWCLGSAEKVVKFKRSLDARRVAYALIRRYCDGEVLYNLHLMNNSFLRWKFASEDDVVAFKQSSTDANPDNDDLYLLLFAMFRKRPCERSDRVSTSRKKSRGTRKSRKSRIWLRKSRKSILFQCRLKRK
ncbi:uncharacterized protein LOC135843470 isoform X1 [Planococcus citri]|uniref:uncharacterized protein LOC135843470 isoform X1 n=1 Tax=Planococcus citri TaxID=170843 RepID=UPI0031F81398